MAVSARGRPSGLARRGGAADGKAARRPRRSILSSRPDLMSDPITTQQGLLAVLGLAGLFAGVYVFDEIIPNPQE